MAKKKTEAPAVQPVATHAVEIAETQSLVFKRSHPGYAYWPGDAASLTGEHAKLLLAGGFAELAPTQE